MVKNFQLILLCLLCYSNVHGQLFCKKDTLHSNKVFQFGIGGFFGSYGLKVSNGDLNYHNRNGLDNGVFFKGEVELIKKIVVSAELRYLERRCFVNQGNSRYQEFFYLRHKGTQIPITISYTFNKKHHKEIMRLYGGMCYNSVQFDTEGNFLWLPPNTITTLSGSSSWDGVKKKYESYLIGVSKRMPAKSKLNLLIFSEVEYVSNFLTFGMAFRDLSTNVREVYSTTYDSFSFRVGLGLIY